MDESRDAERAVRDLAIHLERQSRPFDPAALRDVRTSSTPKRRGLVIVTALAGVVSLFGLWAASRGSETADPVDTGAPTTAPTADGIRYNDLPPEGLAVWNVGGTEVELFDLSGEPVGALPVDPGRVSGRPSQLGIGADHGLAIVGPTVSDPAEVPPGCSSAVGIGGVRIATCGETAQLPDRIQRVDALGARTDLVISPPGLDVGLWQWILPSADGALVLAQWSGECEIPTAWVVSTADGSIRPAVAAAEVPESIGLGWMPDGRALVQVLSGVCGFGGEPGVYAVDLGTNDAELVLALPDNHQASIWAKTEPTFVDAAFRTFVRAATEIGVAYSVEGDQPPVELVGRMQWDGIDVVVHAATATSGLPYVPFNDLVIESHPVAIASGPGTAGVQDTGSFAAVTCGPRVWTVTGPDETVAVAALSALVPRLYCTLGSAPVASGHEDLSEQAQMAAAALGHAFFVLAVDPSDANLAALPFADRVSLGLGSDVQAVLDRGDLADPATWMLPADGYSARAGSISALELVANTNGSFRAALRPTSCPESSPPFGPPETLTGYEDIAIQPLEVSSCIDWFSVTLYLHPTDETIVGVVVNLVEP